MIHVCGPSFEEASKEYPGHDFFGMHINFSAEEFVRMLAKIDFCAAVATVGIGAFTNTPIRKVILGTDQCIGDWVGSWWHEPVNGTNGGLHEIRIVLSEPGKNPRHHQTLRAVRRARIPRHAGPGRPIIRGIKRMARAMGQNAPHQAITEALRNTYTVLQLVSPQLPPPVRVVLICAEYPYCHAVVVFR
jgi:hypothetical protein